VQEEFKAATPSDGEIALSMADFLMKRLPAQRKNAFGSAPRKPVGSPLASRAMSPLAMAAALAFGPCLQPIPEKSIGYILANL
jgi:hypothetical protein